MENEKFAIDDFYATDWDFKAYFIDILNKEYDLEEAIKDLRGLIGSKHDSRVNNTSENE